MVVLLLGMDLSCTTITMVPRSGSKVEIQRVAAERQFRRKFGSSNHFDRPVQFQRVGPIGDLAETVEEFDNSQIIVTTGRRRRTNNVGRMTRARGFEIR